MKGNITALLFPLALLLSGSFESRAMDQTKPVEKASLVQKTEPCSLITVTLNENGILSFFDKAGNLIKKEYIEVEDNKVEFDFVQMLVIKTSTGKIRVPFPSQKEIEKAQTEKAPTVYLQDITVKLQNKSYYSAYTVTLNDEGKIQLWDSKGILVGTVSEDFSNTPITKFSFLSNERSFLIHTNEDGKEKVRMVAVGRNGLLDRVIPIATRLEEVNLFKQSVASDAREYKRVTLDTQGVVQFWNQLGALVDTEPLIYPTVNKISFTGRKDAVVLETPQGGIIIMDAPLVEKFQSATTQAIMN